MQEQKEKQFRNLWAKWDKLAGCQIWNFKLSPIKIALKAGDEWVMGGRWRRIVVMMMVMVVKRWLRRNGNTAGGNVKESGPAGWWSPFSLSTIKWLSHASLPAVFPDANIPFYAFLSPKSISMSQRFAISCFCLWFAAPQLRCSVFIKNFGELNFSSSSILIYSNDRQARCWESLINAKPATHIYLPVSGFYRTQVSLVRSMDPVVSN